jgi:hypothetical protein
MIRYLVSELSLKKLRICLMLQGTTVNRGNCRKCFTPIFYVGEAKWVHMDYVEEDADHDATPINEGM